jgi:hypothetical protein
MKPGLPAVSDRLVEALFSVEAGQGRASMAAVRYPDLNSRAAG